MTPTDLKGRLQPASGSGFDSTSFRVRTAPEANATSLASVISEMTRSISPLPLVINEFTSTSEYVRAIVSSELEPFGSDEKFRANLFKTEAGVHELHFVAHHIAFDRLSMWALVGGLERASLTLPSHAHKGGAAANVMGDTPIEGRALWVRRRVIDRAAGPRSLTEHSLNNHVVCLAAFGEASKCLVDVDKVTVAAAAHRPAPTAIGSFVRMLDVNLPFQADGTLALGEVRAALLVANRKARAGSPHRLARRAAAIGFNYNVSPAFASESMLMAVHDVWGAHLAAQALRLEIEERPRGWQIELFYDPHRVSEREADHLLDEFERNIGVPSAVQFSPRPHRAEDEPFASRALHRLWGLADRPVVVDDTPKSGYEVATEALAVAQTLRRLRPGSGHLVGVALRPSAHALAAFLGILLSGNVYLPLDRSLPPAQTLARIRQADPSIVIAEPPIPSQYIDNVPQIEVPASEDASNPDAQPPSVGPGAAVAYELFTSGSTGAPKIVDISMENLEYLADVVRAVRTEVDRSRAIPDHSPAVHVGASSAFDAHIWEYLLVLEAGFVGHIASNLDLDAWRRNYHTVDVVTAVPSMLALVSHESPQPPVIISVGEKLTPALSESLKQQARLYNAYGPAEGTICATMGAVNTEEDLDSIVGRPIGGSSIYVLDWALNPVPAGSVGEVYIGGPGVSLGYRNQPRQTAAAFVPDPFTLEPGARMYRTGDLGAITGLGSLRIVGRADEQVKVAGQRVELSEITDHLRSHPLVTDAASLVIDTSSGQKVAAFIELRSGGDKGPDEVKAWIRRELPRWARPSSLQVVSRIPRLPSGKTDRAALLRIGPDALAMRDDADAGESPNRAQVTDGLVEALRAEWQNVLEGSLATDVVVSADSNVLDLGASSLDVARFAWRVAQYRAHATVQSVYEFPVIAEYARYLQEQDPDDGPRTSAPKETRAPRASNARQGPASPLQAQLYFQWKLSPGDPTYNIPLAYAVTGQLSREKLQAAISRVQARQPALRSSLTEAAGQVILNVSAVGRDPIVVQLEHTDGPTAARDRVAMLAKRPFNLQEAPLVRVWIISYPGGQILLVSAHHAVFDAESATLLFRELRDAYDGSERGPRVDSPSLLQPPSFADTSAYDHPALVQLLPETRIDVGQLIARSESKPNSPSLDHAGVVRVQIEDATARAVRAASLRHSVSHYALVLAAFARLAGDLLDCTDIAVISPMSYRRRREDSELIGCLVDSNVVRINLPGGADKARQIVQHSQLAIIESLDRPWLPLSSLRKMLRREGLLDRLPELSLQVINAPLRVTLGDATLVSQSPPPSGARQRLQIQLSEDGTAAVCDAMFDPGEFTNEEVAGFVERLIQTLSELAFELSEQGSSRG